MSFVVARTAWKGGGSTTLRAGFLTFRLTAAFGIYCLTLNSAALKLSGTLAASGVTRSTSGFLKNEAIPFSVELFPSCFTSFSSVSLEVEPFVVLKISQIIEIMITRENLMPPFSDKDYNSKFLDTWDKPRHTPRH
jgi:hypothetical protein